MSPSTIQRNRRRCSTVALRQLRARTRPEVRPAPISDPPPVPDARRAVWPHRGLWCAKAVLGLLGVLLAFQPGVFQSVIAGHYEAEVRTVAEQQEFVDRIIAISERSWKQSRFVGRRIELKLELVGDGASADFTFAPKDGKPPSLWFATSRCPGGKGGRIVMFLHEVTDVEFGPLDVRKREYALEGTYEVGTMRFREGSNGPYCYVDMRLIRA